jgi:uncharacterized membrane protein HdeD (DUF308 family)
MSNRSMWSGVVMIIAGIIFLAASNTGGRSSKLGLIVGCLIVLLGVMRMMKARGAAPPVG